MANPLEPRVLVGCSRCSVVFSMTRRNARSPAAHHCEWCRMWQKRRRPSAADRAYWTERFTPEEIRELATGIWG